MKHCQKVRDNVLDVIRDKHLVRVQVNFVLAQFHLFFELRKVENACQIEREVHVEVNVKQWILEIHRVQILVKLLVILILQFRRLSAPQGLGLVDDIRNLRFDFLDGIIFVLFARRVIFPIAGCS